jgi:hypothetical protein
LALGLTLQSIHRTNSPTRQAANDFITHINNVSSSDSAFLSIRSTSYKNVILDMPNQDLELPYKNAMLAGVLYSICIVASSPIISSDSQGRAFEKGDRERAVALFLAAKGEGREEAKVIHLLLNSKGEFGKAWCIMSCHAYSTTHVISMGVAMQLFEKDRVVLEPSS